MIERTLLLIFGCALSGHGQSSDPPALPPPAAAIEVPSGAILKYHFLAEGKQIYRCANGTWSAASTPDAMLTDVRSGLRVHHQAGPSWTTLDGHSTLKANGASAAHFAAPDGVSIDWLKLNVDPSTRSGEFSDVDTIQRLYTGAGKPPAGACSTGATYDSPYTAHYYFWVSPRSSHAR